MECRENCGACCIAPSINQAYYKMPKGKPAGTACIHLDLNNFQCAIWGSAHYPPTCKNFKAEVATCGQRRDEAIEIITLIEEITLPK